jgi:hypothetical protein
MQIPHVHAMLPPPLTRVAEMPVETKFVRMVILPRKKDTVTILTFETQWLTTPSPPFSINTSQR